MLWVDYHEIWGLDSFPNIVDFSSLPKFKTTLSQVDLGP